MSINQTHIKKLFGLSAGRCNHCKCSLIEENVQIGEMAHIIARSSGGPRSIDGQSNINTYDNLILLCANHHKIVDSASNDYPVDYLKELKRSHEEYVKKNLDQTSEYFADLSALNTLFRYIPILQFRGMAIDLPNKVSFDFEDRNMFDAFVQGNPQSFPFWDHSLTNLWNDFIYKMDYLDLWLGGNLRGNDLVTNDDIFSGKPFINIYVDNDHGYMVLNKESLDWNQINLVNENVGKLRQDFVTSHSKLVDYIRYNFKDIKW